MKRDLKLRLVPPPPDRGDEPPFTEEELAEAAALRESLERDNDPLAGALRAAWRPAALDEGDLDALLARALGDPSAPPTRHEREAATQLREDLERREASSAEAELAGALRSASRPEALAPERNEALIARALAGAGRGRVVPIGRARRLVPMAMAALTGVAALAAGVSLLLRTELPSRLSTAPPSVAAAHVAPSLIRARSTDDLFDPAQKFELGEASARIDRIEMSRAQDLRKNRFAAWGVR